MTKDAFCRLMIPGLAAMVRGTDLTLRDMVEARMDKEGRFWLPWGECVMIRDFGWALVEAFFVMIVVMGMVLGIGRWLGWI